MNLVNTHCATNMFGLLRYSIMNGDAGDADDGGGGDDEDYTDDDGDWR